MDRQQITAPEAARQAGVMLPYLYALLAVGRLRGEKVDGKWQIAREDFDAWRKTRRQNQKSCQRQRKRCARRVSKKIGATFR